MIPQHSEVQEEESYDDIPSSTPLYWIIACTFIWAFLVAPLGVRWLFGWSGWFASYGYSIMCVIAGICLLKVRKDGSWIFALVNFGFGIGWIVFTILIARAFARSFWR